MGSSEPTTTGVSLHVWQRYCATLIRLTGQPLAPLIGQRREVTATGCHWHAPPWLTTVSPSAADPGDQATANPEQDRGEAPRENSGKTKIKYKQALRNKTLRGKERVSRWFSAGSITLI